MSSIEMIETVGISVPEHLGLETFEKAKALITPFIEQGQPLTDLLNKLQAHQIPFERASETEQELPELMCSGLSLRNYWYQFSDNPENIALLQCVVKTVVKTLTSQEIH